MNVFAAEVGAGWWRDKIVNFAGRKSAFRGVVEFSYSDGTKRTVGTDDRLWRAATCGPVTHSAIFDGEEFDARVQSPAMGNGAAFAKPEVNTEFAGEILPTDGAEVVLRHDLALAPVAAYAWKGVSGAGDDAFGTVVKTRTFDPSGPLEVLPGETLVVDFGQNCAGVPSFDFSAAEGTVLTCLPGEMLNDRNGEKVRGNDGPGGSIYRRNLRCPEIGMRAVYTFGGAPSARYMPRFTFFGYRYVSITATGKVAIRRLLSVPVTSVTKEMESGSIETGDPAVNRLVSNIRWGQLSNYLSVPTDCPQRNERLGWTADTQVFCEAGSFNADTSAFFRKWMRDMRDSQGEMGGFPGVAPFAQYGNNQMRLGWADAGVVVPYVIWLQFGEPSIVDDNWAAMERFLFRVAETKYRTEDLPECGNYQWSDWLSLAKLESCPYRPELSAFETGADGKKIPKPDALRYWNYLGGCHWLSDARMMATMAAATGRAADAGKYRAMAAEAEAYLRKSFIGADGRIAEFMRGMQTPALFALRLGLVDGEARERMLSELKESIAAGGGTLHTGFLGTAIALDTLTENGLHALAYDLLLNHKFPGWLYSVDQGATTMWERWNSYVKDTGFGPVGMNSFNHYAYGSVLAWMYRRVAGIAADPAKPGYANVVMRPVPDRRLGRVSARYRTPHGVVESAWRYEGDRWIWEFAVPAGATASVTLPGDAAARAYGPGRHRVERPAGAAR